MSATAQPTRMRRRERLHQTLSALGVYVLVAVLFVVGCMISSKFLTQDNLLNLLRDVMILGIVCVGAAFITYSRHYVDLSIPGIMALSGIVTVSVLPYGLWTAIAAGMLTGMAVGTLNGFAVGYLKLNPIIWTLAMMSVLFGVIRIVYGGKQVYPDAGTAVGRAFLELYHVEVFGLMPLPFVLFVAIAFAADFVLRRTGYGLKLKLTGAAYDTARMTGIEVRRIVALAFVISSALSALAGILLTSFNKVGAHYIGKDYDFQAVTAVVVGGMTLAGGRGTMAGVIGGVMVIALLNKVMSLVRIGEFVIGDFQKNLVIGAVFILVVGVNSFSRRKSGLDDA
ncbi:MAG: ABC transporter permease [Planctomycetota bacterium]